MLGLKRKGGWAGGFAFGKHPSFKDFLSVGREDSLARALARWVEGGYREVAEKGGLPLSWRFWCRGIGEGWFCGVLRDSADALGRPFPLLLVLWGRFPGWEKEWERLGERLEGVWRELERMATRNWSSPGEMERAMEHLPAPEDGGAGFLGGVEEKRFFEAHRGCFWTYFGEGFTEGMLSSLRAQFREVPRALFIGGDPVAARLVVFTGPLERRDFVFLWQKEKEAWTGRL